MSGMYEPVLISGEITERPHVEIHDEDGFAGYDPSDREIVEVGVQAGMSKSAIWLLHWQTRNHHDGLWLEALGDQAGDVETTWGDGDKRLQFSPDNFINGLLGDYDD